jgi:hypothetical protein
VKKVTRAIKNKEGREKGRTVKGTKVKRKR